MKSRNEVSEVRERFTDGSGDEPREPSPESWMKAVIVLAMVLVAAVSAGVMFSSCGSQGDSRVVQKSDAPAVAPEAGGQTQVASVVAQPSPSRRVAAPADAVVREGLPPDLSVSVPDTLVTPGEAVEFCVQGTPDVSQVALSDGRDEPMPFVHDQPSDTWRTTYRVPLHPRHERFGISVTARTDAERWRRVWVFLHVKGDSTSAGLTPEEDDHRMDGDQ